MLIIHLKVQKKLDKLPKLNENVVQDTVSAESFIELNGEVVTSASCVSDADILAEVIWANSAEDEDDGDDNDDDLNDNKIIYIAHHH